VVCGGRLPLAKKRGVAVSCMGNLLEMCDRRGTEPIRAVTDGLGSQTTPVALCQLKRINPFGKGREGEQLHVESQQVTVRAFSLNA